MESLNEIANTIVHAAEAGETEWPKAEDFHKRFGIARDVDSHLLTRLIDQLGWTVTPFQVEDLKVVENALGTGYDLPSGKPIGYRLVRS